MVVQVRVGKIAEVKEYPLSSPSRFLHTTLLFLATFHLHLHLPRPL